MSVQAPISIPPTTNIYSESLRRAMEGGFPGGIAMSFQVVSLIWLRTTCNYQYRHGTSTMEALKALYKDGGRGLGGIRRFYRGVAPALVEAPMAKFGDVAANVGVLHLMNNHPDLKDLPMSVKTAGASVTAALWRINLFPLDTFKTMLQVEGKAGTQVLLDKIKSRGPSVLYAGASANVVGIFMRHFTWWYTHNLLNERLPKNNEETTFLRKQLKHAGMGLTCAVTSDILTNSLRVIKTYRQVHPTGVSYLTAVGNIYKQDGALGIFGRGLQTRLLANGLQSILFTVMWKTLDEYLTENKIIADWSKKDKDL